MRSDPLINIFRWLKSRDAPEKLTVAEFCAEYADTYVRELAFQACTNLVANAVSKCEVKTYRNGEEVRGDEWYLWNYHPNQNQNASEFWHKLIHTLFTEGEALVVEDEKGRVYVADSFIRTPYALYDDEFRGVTVGTFTWARTFYSSDVLYFTWGDGRAKQVIDGLYDSYARLIRSGIDGYEKSRGEKGVLELDSQSAGSKEFQDTYANIKNDGFRKFATAENAVLPLWRGMKYTSLGSKTYNSDSTRDIRAMIDDVTDFTARGLCIPPPLLNGSVQDVSSATDQLLTFCIDPLVDSLHEEMNRKRYGKAGVLAGNHLEFDTRKIKHVDLLESAPNIEKLISSGFDCVNDVRVLTGQAIINEPWAWEHFMTKNYSKVSEMLEAAEKGGNE